MEFLVTMTTHVPDGTSEDAVAEMRVREAARSLELATQGHLLRLWRPPLAPGEWRTLGLFNAATRGELGDVLLSMPLRVWRTDEIQPLLPHPNDPGPASEPCGPVPDPDAVHEFLTTFSMTVSPGTPTARADGELTGREHLLRLWALVGDGQTLGLWRVHDSDEMQAILTSLPLSAGTGVETIQLSPHPNDPGLADTWGRAGT
jgi:muconolactone delta-isomerase